MQIRPGAALVRAVSPRIAEGELTYLERSSVDVPRARAQHAAYVELLRRHDLEIIYAPPAADHPDGVFVEDAVVVLDGLAILTRPGAPSRRDEPATLRQVLSDYGLGVAAIEAPGTVDGGDVLAVDETLFVGRTLRTDDTAIGQLRELVRPLGRRVVPVDVDGVLHLKSAVTALPDGRLIASPRSVDAESFEGREVLTALEPSGSDVLLLGDVVVLSASAPRTAAHLADLGYAVETIDLSELEKVEAGPTCPSVLLPPREALQHGR